MLVKKKRRKMEGKGDKERKENEEKKEMINYW